MPHCLSVLFKYDGPQVTQNEFIIHYSTHLFTLGWGQARGNTEQHRSQPQNNNEVNSDRNNPEGECARQYLRSGGARRHQPSGTAAETTAARS